MPVHHLVQGQVGEDGAVTENADTAASRVDDSQVTQSGDEHQLPGVPERVGIADRHDGGVPDIGDRDPRPAGVHLRHGEAP